MKLLSLALRLRRVAQTRPAGPKPLTLAEAAARPLALLEAEDAFEHIPFEPVLQANVEALQAIWRHQEDLIVRPVYAGGREFAFVYLKGTVDERRLESDAVGPLSRYEEPLGQRSLRELARTVLSNLKTDEVSKLADGISQLARGHALLFANGASAALSLLVGYRPSRSISSPQNEKTIRGPHEGLTEAIDGNVALLRARIRSPLLRFESFTIGRITRTPVKIAYIEGLARQETLDEVHQRLRRVDIDGLLESGQLREFLEDTPYTIFPTVWESERPDAIAGQLLEGGVAILVDGSPWALCVPTTLWALFQASEDYYQSYYVASFTRLLRLFAGTVTALLPAVYVAVLIFHPEALPQPLLLQIAATAESTPLPTVGEVALMLIAFDVLLEAGIRLPAPVGQTIGIVGGLFVGQMSVQAALVTPTIVIVAALSTIGSFLTPHYSLGNALRLTRYLALVAGATLGLFGVMLFIITLLGHLSWLRSFGMPYLWPARPKDFNILQDATFRYPWWHMWRRPASSRRSGTMRQGFPLRPQRHEASARPTSEGSELS